MGVKQRPNILLLKGNTWLSASQQMPGVYDIKFNNKGIISKKDNNSNLSKYWFNI